VASIFDLDEAKAQSLADAFAIGNLADSLEQAVRSTPEGAVFDVATPAAAYLSVIPQLPSGSGLLMQKAMGETRAQAREIRELCRSKNLTAPVNFQLRFAPAIQAARRLIAEGVIGDPHHMEVRLWSIPVASLDVSSWHSARRDSVSLHPLSRSGAVLPG
jgi:predicted dehydrogenase